MQRIDAMIRGFQTVIMELDPEDFRGLSFSAIETELRAMIEAEYQGLELYDSDMAYAVNKIWRTVSNESDKQE